MIYQAYFIGCKVDDEISPFVKIGRGDVEQRLSTLQIGCPYQLAIIGVTNNYSETELHQRFNHLRVRGEWFRLDKELQRLIFNCDYTPQKISIITERDYQWAIEYSKTDGRTDGRSQIESFLQVFEETI
jgi:hypothetical protein